MPPEGGPRALVRPSANAIPAGRVALVLRGVARLRPGGTTSENRPGRPMEEQVAAWFAARAAADPVAEPAPPRGAGWHVAEPVDHRHRVRPRAPRFRRSRPAACHGRLEGRRVPYGPAKPGGELGDVPGRGHWPAGCPRAIPRQSVGRPMTSPCGMRWPRSSRASRGTPPGGHPVMASRRRGCPAGPAGVVRDRQPRGLGAGTCVLPTELAEFDRSGDIDLWSHERFLRFMERDLPRRIARQVEQGPDRPDRPRP